MALIGDLTIYEHKQSETETIIIDVEYPSDIQADHPDFEKAGTVEQLEVPKIITTITEYNNCYVVVHSVNSWKGYVGDKTGILANITYRVYDSKEDRENDYESYLHQDFLHAQNLSYELSETEIEQAYKLVNNTQGFENLKKD